jgi:hypothetical protein
VDNAFLCEGNQGQVGDVIQSISLISPAVFWLRIEFGDHIDLYLEAGVQCTGIEILTNIADFHSVGAIRRIPRRRFFLELLIWVELVNLIERIAAQVKQVKK